jgi:hypothetical protein
VICDFSASFGVPQRLSAFLGVQEVFRALVLSRLLARGINE